MIIKIKEQASAETTEGVKMLLEERHIPYIFQTLHKIPAFAVSTALSPEVEGILSRMAGIDEIVNETREYPFASKAFKAAPDSFCVKNNVVGGNAINIVAGPCSIESEEQIFRIAEFISSLGVRFIRGGAYKPRTSPYRFQGLGLDGLKMIRKAADEFGLCVVTEVLDTSLIDKTYPYADILQIGSRNMQNFHFLKQLGKLDKPLLLKRGMNASVEEWLMAAEYILAEGNEKLILCERGIRSFDNMVRNTMDVAAIPLAKSLSHLPVWADPSHGTGRRELVGPMALASVAAGADGLIMEIHPDPDHALSDGAQSLYPAQFSELLLQLQSVSVAVNRNIETQMTKRSENLNLCVE